MRLWSETHLDGIALHEEGVILDANAALAAMFGCELREMIGRNAADFLAPECRESVTERVVSGFSAPYEAMGLRKDGTRFPMRLHGRTISHGGRRLRLSIIRDLSEHQQAGEALRASEERYLTLAETAHDMIYIVNRDDVIEYVNSAAARQWGRTPEEMIGQPRTRFFPEDTSQRQRQNLERVLATGEPLQLEIKTPFPQRDMWLDIRLVPLRDTLGNVTRVLGLSRDITERKQAEQSLRESEARYRALAEAAHDMIFTIRRDGVVEYVNSFAASYLGLRPDQVIGRPRSQFFPADDERQAQNLQRIFETGEPAYFEDRTLFPKGEVWLGTWLVPIRSAAGEVIAVQGISRDITERKRTEQALRESEARYRTLIECATDAIFLADAETGVILDANRKAEQLTGLPAEQLIGMHQSQLHPPEEAERYREIFRKHLQGGGMISTNLVVRHRDGREIPVEIGASIIEHGHRRIVHGIFRDITDRLQAEETLRLQSAALESAANGILITTRDGVVIWVNPAFTRLTGFAPDEIVGQNVRLLKSGEHPPEFHARMWETILAGNVWQGEVVNRRKDGQTYVQEQTITPLRDRHGEIQHFIAIQQDITERKRMETELRDSRQRFERIFLSNPEAITITSRTDNRFLEVNDSFLVPLGFTREEVLGRTPLQLGLYADQKDRERLLETLREQGCLRNFECRIRGKAGRVLDVLLSAELMQLGDEPCLLTIANDITRWKQQQAELEERLRRAQKLESIGTLAGGVAHDFNNILTVIQGHVCLLLAEEDLPAVCSESLRQVSEAAERAANLTRQLLTFSRKQPMQRRPIDLNEVVGTLTKMLRRIIGEDIGLEIRCAPRLPLVLADVGMMEQVLMNLAINARDAIHARQLVGETGVLVLGTETVMAQAPRSQPGLDRPLNQYVCLKVSDNGAGIPAEIRDRIYDPFFTTKDVGQGTGLGLATVHGIVQEHGGWIDVESRIAHGTTFRVYLPASAREPLRAPELRAVQPPRGGTETILLVEDEAALRELAREVLERFGYRVLVAASGREALTVWKGKASEIDLLLTDIVMPEGVSGRQLADRLVVEKPGLKVILTSGYSAEIAGQSFTPDDGTYFLQKPYPPQELAQMVRNCLDGKR